ncbi:Peritrophin-1 [Pseudolycoriella hygida]|uniref:Peritrophin-1 n=1 Tax=Pseudolycoriella hygida TaxID=35572 RepID=A0A9Q0NBF4_9DIPT|nr:Peritrophin-1 [Pseudolycoriella hygida]
MAIGEILSAFCLLFHLIHGSSIVLRADAPDLCHGRHGIFIKNEKGCEFFFYCHHGQPLEAFCPGDFWFNEDSGICEDQKNVLCTLNDPVKPPIVHPDITDETVNCPVVDTFSITFIASKIDCNRYYICYHGSPIRQQCIKEMHWNPAINKCDYPDNAKCEIKPSLPICPRKGQVFYPHPEMCDYFIYCQDGYLTVQQCPFYYHWDTVTQSCRWRNLARCASKAFLV